MPSPDNALLVTWPNSRLLGNLTAGESTPTSLSAKPVFRAEVGPIRRNQIRQVVRQVVKAASVSYCTTIVRFVCGLDWQSQRQMFRSPLWYRCSLGCPGRRYCYYFRRSLPSQNKRLPLTPSRRSPQFSSCPGQNASRPTATSLASRKWQRRLEFACHGLKGSVVE